MYLKISDYTQSCRLVGVPTLFYQQKGLVYACTSNYSSGMLINVNGGNARTISVRAAVAATVRAKYYVRNHSISCTRKV